MNAKLGILFRTADLNQIISLKLRKIKVRQAQKILFVYSYLKKKLQGVLSRL